MSQGLSPGEGSQAQRFARALEAAWDEKGVSRRDLARVMAPDNVDNMKSQIAKWAVGMHGISDPNAERLSAALSQLLGRTAYDPDYFKKDPNAPKSWESAFRLAALEAKVEEQGEQTTKALKALTAGIRRLERRLEALAPPATERGSSR